MKAQTNVTIRIEQDLKIAAEICCAKLDITLSQVVRAALRQLVQDQHRLGIQVLQAEHRQVVSQAIAAGVYKLTGRERRQLIGQLEDEQRSFGSLDRTSSVLLEQLRIQEVSK